MRLFHVSEESDIREFLPRTPTRDDLDRSVGLVWAIEESKLSNFLTPRNCPRVGYHVAANTTAADRAAFFATSSAEHALVIEGKWFEIMRDSTLYLYEFDLKDFELQDASAGYYVAKTRQIPIAKHTITDLFSELIRRDVELHVVENLWDIADRVKRSTLDWSLCRMAFAKPRE